MSQYSFETQKIPLRSLINARELGGYVLPDGRRIKHNLLLRGASLAKVSDEDVAWLRDEAHLAHIFDFRMDVEIQRAPDREIDGAEFHWLPAIDPATMKRQKGGAAMSSYRNAEEYVLALARNRDVQIFAKSMYPSLVMSEWTQLQYASFLQFAVKSEGAIYWHCTQGKDRTGFGAAVLLAALGADRELIMQDFAISNEFYRDQLDALIGKLSEMGCGETEFDVARTFVGVNCGYFSYALDLIEKYLGGMDSYLRNELCLTDEDREILKAKYLE